MTIKIVPTPEDADHANIVVCMRVSILPIPYVQAEIEHCSKCNERIWVSLTSPKSPPRVCFQCAEQLIKEDGDEPTIMVTERSLSEAEKFFGKVIKKDDNT